MGAHDIGLSHTGPYTAVLCSPWRVERCAELRIVVCCLGPCRVPCRFVQSLTLVRRAQNSIPSIHLKQFRLVLVATLLMLRRVQVCTTLKFSGQKSLKLEESF